MFKRLFVIAAAAAMLLPAAANAGVVQSSSAKASALIQPLCHTVSLGVFDFGPIVPNGQTSNTAYGQGPYDYAGSSLTNDCVSGTTYQIALFSANGCNLTNGSSNIPWFATVNGGSQNLLNCTSTVPPSAPTNSVSFAAGTSGTNTVQLVGAFTPPTQASGLNAGTYTDNVTAAVYF